MENVKGLKWHKFLIYFGLWASGIFALITGLLQLTVMNEFGLLQLTVMNEFQLFPTWLTMSHGVALIIWGCYCIYVRFQLAGFKKNAPQKFLLSMLAYAIIQLAFIVISPLSLGLPPGEVIPVVAPTLIGGVIGTGIGYWIHKIYYDNRKELFNK